MTDTNGDDVADTLEKFSDFVGGIQEHGPHAIRRGPDGIPTIILGNNTFYPDEMVNPAGLLGGAGTPNPSKESQFLPALPDGRGFGPSVKEGLHGTIARIDEQAKQSRCWSAACATPTTTRSISPASSSRSTATWNGTSTCRGIATCGPCMAFPAATTAIATARRKFPPYFIDSLPNVRDLGRGSPVGVEFYQHNVYPEEFRDAYFEADWSRGRLLWTRARAHRRDLQGDEAEGRVRPRRAAEHHRRRSRPRRFDLLLDRRPRHAKAASIA